MTRLTERNCNLLNNLKSPQVGYAASTGEIMKLQQLTNTWGFVNLDTTEAHVNHNNTESWDFSDFSSPRGAVTSIIKKYPGTIIYLFDDLKEFFGHFQLVRWKTEKQSLK
jgi:hypothetical protein